MSKLLSSSIDIRTFVNWQDVQDLPTFVKSNPLSTENYNRLVGDYFFEEEVECCVLKENGNLCRTAHKRGWVALLKDGSVTIIGNHCAHDKFGADSRLLADSNRYLNEKRRLRQLAALAQSHGEKPLRIAQLNQLQIDLEKLLARSNEFSAQLGLNTLKRLRDMARTRRSDVAITAVKFRDYLDEKGKPQRERSTFTQSLGSIGGVDILSPSFFYAIYEEIKDVKNAYQRAEELTQEIKPKSKEIESVANRLNAYNGILLNGNRLLEMEKIFFDSNLLPLCFLVSDRSERFKAAKIAMRTSGQAGTKDDAKAWLSEQEKAIKRQLKVDALEI